MNAQDLKNSILQLAIQGKLVEQREEEGTAKELLKKIEAEKKQLIKEGKIKKQKELPDIKEDEIPFDIPKSWEWVRLGDITHNWGQKKPDTTFDYIDVSSIDNVNGRLSNDENLVEAKNAPSRARKLLKKGSVIYSTVRPYLLNLCIIDKEFKYEPIASTAFAILHPFCGLNENYLYHVLRSSMFISYVNSMMLGVAYPAINDANLLSGLIPIPPLEEQKRIVAKIEELMPYVDKYDVAYSEVEKLNKKFPEDMQKSILQYAIQGKLVEQREEEGTAEELYKQIQKEKQKLIKEGKIKKEKPLPGITADEIPFEIPESWKWVRLGELFEINPRNNVADETNISFIPMKLIEDGYRSEFTYETKSWREVKKGYTHFQNGDIVVAKITPCFQNLKSAIMVNLVNNFGAGTTELHVLRSYNNVIGEFFLWVIKSPSFIESCVKNMTGTAGQKRVPTNIIKDYLVPLPPFEEQKRIVNRIEELLPYTKQLIK